MTKVEDVIKRAAIECHMGLQEDDPIMSLVTVMNQITEDQHKDMQSALAHHRQEYEEAAYRWREDAGNIATGIVTAALNAGKQTLGDGMKEGAAQVIAMIRKENAVAVAAQQLELGKAAADIRHCCTWMFRVNVALAVVVVLALAISRL